MNPPTAPIRAALYARVSTTGKGQDVGLQLEELRQVAALRGWAVVEHVYDGVPTRKDARPAHDRVMADARFDRFVRSMRELLETLEESRILGISFVPLRESVDTTTPMGRTMFTIIAAIADLERDIIQERVLAGVRRAQAAGKHCGRPRKDVDLRPAVAVLREGRDLKEPPGSSR